MTTWHGFPRKLHILMANEQLGIATIGSIDYHVTIMYTAHARTPWAVVIVDVLCVYKAHKWPIQHVNVAELVIVWKHPLYHVMTWWGLRCHWNMRKWQLHCPLHLFLRVSSYSSVGMKYRQSLWTMDATTSWTGMYLPIPNSMLPILLDVYLSCCCHWQDNHICVHCMQ